MGWFDTWLRGRTGRTYHDVDFGFDLLESWAAVVILIAVFIVVFVWSRSALSGHSGAARHSLPSLRAAAVALLLFAALGPTLTGRRSDPSTRLALLLFDDSASMSVTDATGQSPGARMLASLRRDDRRFERLLAGSHTPRYYRFGSGVDAIRTAADLRFDQRETRIQDAVRAAVASSSARAAAAIVFSDGVEQPGPARVSSGDQGHPGIPVFTVGIGPERAPPSLALEQLSVTRTNFDRSPVAVVARIASTGLAGRRAVIEVVEGARTMASAPVRLPEEGRVVARLEFVPDLEGFRSYTARVRFADAAADTMSRLADDPFPLDNERLFVIDNRRRAWRILYFSGRPNWQQKFVRRALEDDPAFEVSSLIRISGPESKFEFRGAGTTLANPLFQGSGEEGTLAPRWDEAVFLRIGVRESELAQGYPSAESELFNYDVVLWGDVERDFFAQQHLALTREFVARRGGSFLVLGGPRALERGGYAGTVIESMLPVVLPRSGRAARDDLSFTPEPTIEGLLSGIFALDPNPERNAALLRDLPPLYGPNRFTGTRAGASVLAELRAGGDRGSEPFFAWQRFGNGLTAVLATGETWNWELGTDPDDGTHGRFWRQLVRGLAQSVSEPVVLSGADDLLVGRSDTLSFTIRDSLFTPREGLRIDLRATGPDGVEAHLPVSESLEEPGVYSVPSRFERIGTHHLALSARDASGRIVARLQSGLAVHPDHRERTGRRFDPGYLRNLAEGTGGRYFDLDRLDELAAALPLTPGEEEHVDRIPVWHFPAIYLLAAALLIAEWTVRRKWGHA